MNVITKTGSDYWVKFPALLKTKTVDKHCPFRRIKMIDLSLIDLDLASARKNYDEVAIASLADSIRRHGLLQPIIVMKNSSSFFEKPRYTCLVGTRRLRACQMLSLAKLPCFVISRHTSYAKILSLVENLQREDLSMFESADSLLFSCMDCSLSAAELAELVSLSRKTIADLIPFSTVDDVERQMIVEHGLTEQQVRALMRIENTSLRRKILTYVTDHGFGEKQTEEYVNTLLKSDERELVRFEDAFVNEFVERLSCHVSVLQKKGIALHLEEFEHRDEVQYLIRLPKS